MNAFKQQCIELRRKDFSLHEIAKITGRPKSSVYFHIRSMPLSDRKWQLIQAKNRLHLRRVADSRRGKSSRAFAQFNRWTGQTVCLVAHLLFDGEIRRGGCIYNNRSQALVKKFESVARSIYTYAPRRHVNKNTGVRRTSYFNVSLSAYLGEKSKLLIKDVVQLSPTLKQEFLRAFFDDEGCIDFRENRRTRRIRGYQKDKKILWLVRRLLADFNIQASVVEPNEVVITGKDNLEKFRGRIGFSPGVKVNGKRTNSTWKKNLEKRTILNKAIASYQK